MADQEFQESDILFEENGNEDHYDHRRNPNPKKLKRNKKKKENSRPVNIPGNASVPTTNSSWFRTMDSKNLFEESYEDDALQVGITPPHVILRRRMNGKMAFSVCFGNGRTLKGRDLSQVRNSVLRMTGFYES